MKVIRRSRPLSHRLFLWAMSLCVLSGGVRVWRVMQDWYWLTRVGVQPAPWVLAAGGVVWSITAFAALLWLWRYWDGYAWVGRLVVLLLAALFWADRWFFSRSADVSITNNFVLTLTLVGIILTWWWLRPAPIRAVIQKSNLEESLDG